MTALSVLKITNLMSRISSRCFIVKVNGIRYVVKYGKIDEFICLFLPNVCVITSMTSALVPWEHDYQWYMPLKF